MEKWKRETTHGRTRENSNFDGGEEIQILYKRENPIFAILMVCLCTQHRTEEIVRERGRR